MPSETSGTRHCGSLTIRMPAGAVGHGGSEGSGLKGVRVVACCTIYHLVFRVVSNIFADISNHIFEKRSDD